MLALLKAFALLAPVVKDLVVAIVKGISDSKDPRRTAQRALEEVSRVKAFDELMKQRGKL